MHNTIWKFTLRVTDINEIECPKGAEILCVQVQDGTPCIWAKVDNTESEKEIKIIETFGTGHTITNNGPRRYIGTYQTNGGALIFHVFEYLGI